MHIVQYELPLRIFPLQDVYIPRIITVAGEKNKFILLRMEYT